MSGSNLYPGGDDPVTVNLGLALWGMDYVVAENFITLDAAVGAGGSVKVNGSVITNPNFNGTTPVAPGGNTNVTFQVDGSGNISAYVTSAGGTVTSFSAGALSPLFTTSVATATTTPALTFSLSNAAQNSVFAGPATGGTGAPSYRALVAGDIPSLSSIYLPLAGGTLSGNLTLQSTLTDGSSSVGTSGMLLSSTGTGVAWINSTGITVLWNNIGNAGGSLTLNNTTFNTTFDQTTAAVWDWANITPTVTGAATTLAIASVSTTLGVTTYTIASTTGAASNGWKGASILVAGFTGGNAGNNGTFVVTASTATTVVVTNASGTSAGTGTMISSAVVNSPILEISATINSGTAGTLNSIADVWSIQNIIGSVVPNPTSTLTFTHTGSTGVASVSMPTLALSASISPSSLHNPSTPSYGLDMDSAGRVFVINNGTIVAGFGGNTTTEVVWLGSGGCYSWSSATTPNSAVPDTVLSRAAAGVVQIGTTAANALGNLAYNRTNTVGADYAGTTTITAAATSVTVSYAANYTGTAAPVVVVTPTSDPLALGVPVGYWVVAVGTTGAWTGFTLNIQTALAGNIVFNYMVLGKA